MNRDDSQNMTPVLVFGPVAMNADNTPAAIDIVDCASATILLNVGIGGITFDADNKIEFKITHSDDNSTYTAVAAADVVLGSTCDTSVGTGGIVKSFVAAHAAAATYKIGYRGAKRYLKILADFTGTHGTATPVCVQVIKTRLQQRGVA